MEEENPRVKMTAGKLGKETGPAGGWGSSPRPGASASNGGQPQVRAAPGREREAGPASAAAGHTPSRLSPPTTEGP